MNREVWVERLRKAKRPVAVFFAVALVACAHEGSVPRGVFDVVAKFCQVVVMAQPVVSRLGTASGASIDAGVADSSIRDAR